MEELGGYLFAVLIGAVMTAGIIGYTVNAEKRVGLVKEICAYSIGAGQENPYCREEQE